MATTPTFLLDAPTGPTSPVELTNLFLVLTDWLFAGFMLLAIVFLVLAGWQYISAGGDPTKVAQARNKLFWALVAIIAASMARGIPIAVKGIVGV